MKRIFWCRHRLQLEKRPLDHTDPAGHSWHCRGRKNTTLLKRPFFLQRKHSKLSFPPKVEKTVVRRYLSLRTPPPLIFFQLIAHFGAVMSFGDGQKTIFGTSSHEEKRNERPDTKVAAAHTQLLLLNTKPFLFFLFLLPTSGLLSNKKEEEDSRTLYVARMRIESRVPKKAKKGGANKKTRQHSASACLRSRKSAMSRGEREKK